MTTYSTNNPLGSTDPRDLYDNAQNFDHLSLDMENEQWPDRRGHPRLTWYGIEQKFVNSVIAMGWNPIGTFQAGANLTNINDLIQDETDKTWYRWDDLSSFPKLVAEDSTPESSGGVGKGKWVPVDVNDVLRRQIEDPDGATKYPELQIARWRDIGDVRGWGAKCDGVADDTNAIKAAVLARGGKIVIPGNVFVSSVVDFTGLTSPHVEFLNGAKLRIDTTFQFTARHRAPLSFYQCSNPTVIDADITGAKLDKIGFSGVDPIQDGDAGLEYIQCTGTCSSIRPKVTDVKTWGVIHVNVEGAFVDTPVIKNCQVQSGVGCTGSLWINVVDPHIEYAGLCGIEIETRNTNKRTVVIGGQVSNSRAATMIYGSQNASVTGMQAFNCLYGPTAGGADDDTYNVEFHGCSAISCKNGYLLHRVTGALAKGCTTSRDDIEFFCRQNALDRVFLFDAGTATAYYPASVSALAVGDIVEFDNGVQRNVATIGTATDPTFGSMRTFTTTAPLTSDCYRRSFRRYTEVVNAKRGVYLIDGSNNTIEGGEFSQDTDLIYSSGNHTGLIWRNNTARAVARYFTQISGGTVTGKIEINPWDCVNVTAWNATTKFVPAFATIRNFNFRGGTNAETKLVNAAIIEDGVIGGAACAINSTPTTTGTITLKLNGTDIISGGFTGTPPRNSVTLSAPLAVSGAATLQLTDTVGDIVASGYSVQLRGVFK